MKKTSIFLSILSVASFTLFSCGETNTDLFPSIEEQMSKSTNNPYSNPTYPLLFNEKKATYTADPFVIRGDDGYFYMYCTQTEVYANEEFKTFKKGPVFSSLDLVNWEYVSDVFASYAPEWGASGAGVWAPTVIKVNNKYNYYYSLSVGEDKNPGIGVATSDTPYGPFTHYGKLFNSEEIGVTNSIDPFVLYDEGNLYMAFGSYGGLITIVELSEDGLSLKNGLEYQKEHKVPIAGYEIFELNNYEGTFIFKEKGKYYLLLSTGSCLSGLNSTYRVVCATSDSLFGPYVDSKGRDMFGPNRGDAVVAPSLSTAMGVGHCTVIQDDALNYWMIYHGYDTKENSSYRSLYLDQLLFDPTSGLPMVSDTIASNHEVKNGPYIDALEK